MKLFVLVPPKNSAQKGLYVNHTHWLRPKSCGGVSKKSISAAASMLSQEEPDSVERPPYIVEEAWQQSIEARGIVNNLLRRNKRRTFGKIVIIIILLSPL